MGHSVLFNTLRMNHNNAMMAKTFGCLQQFSKQNLSASVDNSRTMQWRYYSSTKIPLHCLNTTLHCKIALFIQSHY